MIINGTKVKELRGDKRLSAAQLGAAIEMSHTWVFSIEAKEEAEVKTHTAHALARVLGVKVRDLAT